MEFKGNTLGDITGMVTESNLSDLSWLDIKAEDAPVPVVNNPHSVIPQLESAWGWEDYRNPVTNLVPNTITGGPSVKAVSPEEIEATVKVAKKAMMNGLKGQEVLAHLRERVAGEVIEASRAELVKLASQTGLLGHVYIDLSPFDTTKEAAAHIGAGVLKSASYAVGAPAKEASFIDASGNARFVGLPVVESVQYTQGLLAKYASRLQAEGRIASCDAIKSEEDLRQAFVQEPEQEIRVHAADAVAAPHVDLQAASDAADKIAGDMRDRAEAGARWASARPILSYIQTEMLAGKVGSELKESIRSKFASTDIDAHMQDISRLAGLQGLMGPVYVDVSLFRSADEAVKAIKTASVRPQYIIASMEDRDNRLEKVRMATGCKELPRTGVSVREASAMVREMESAGSIEPQMAASLNARLASGESTTNILRDAHLARATTLPIMREGGVYAQFSQGERVASEEVDRGDLRTASVAALSRGFPVSAIEEKVASAVPVGEAATIVRQALSSMDMVSARSLEKCSTMKYNLNPNAKLASAPKCASCVLKIGGMCTKQGVALQGPAVDQLVKMAGTSNPVQEFQLQQPRIASTQIGAIDLSGVVRAPAQDASFNPGTALDSFFSA
jgi:hypothetical protein